MKRAFFYGTTTILLALLGLTFSEYREHQRILDAVERNTNRQLELVSQNNTRILNDIKALHFATLYNQRAKHEDEIRQIVDAYNKTK